VTPESPLPQRIAALKGAIVGVSAVGGTQDRVIRWVAAQGGLAARTDLQVAQVGAPPAIQAALENGRIEAFALSPPEAGLAEAAGYGRRLIDPGADFPSLHGLPNLVLVMKRDPNPALQARITATLAALSDASKRVLADPDAASDLIGAKFFAKIAPPVIRSAMHSLLDGLATGGRFTQEGIAALEQFSVGSGTPIPVGKRYWTNDLIPA
jgi:ABC-type nitrate/sulfonate/bicarbonate transport system substrate-binding protein